MQKFALVFLLILSGLAEAAAEAQLRYNPYTGQREYVPQRAMPRYNPYTRRRELVGPGETLQYNPYTKRREYAPRALCRATIHTPSSGNLLPRTRLTPAFLFCPQ